MNDGTHIIQQEDGLRFITAGNCTFTLKSLKSGKHITYKAVYSEYCGTGKIYIKYMSGSDNESNYTRLCSIEPSGILKKRSKVNPESLSWKVFRYVYTKLITDTYMPGLEIWHSGTCARCGRKLTVPESIESGYGPECINLVNKFQL